MKTLIIALLAVTSAPAFAGSYDCSFTVSKDGETVGTMRLDQDQIGMSAGSALYILPVSRHKKFFGKTIREVDVVLSGIIAAGKDLSECSIQGEISLNTTTITDAPQTERQLIAKVSGAGEVSIHEFGAGYLVVGQCTLNP